MDLNPCIPADPVVKEPVLPCPVHGCATRHVFEGGRLAHPGSGTLATHWMYRCTEDGCNNVRVWGLAQGPTLTPFKRVN